MDDEGAREWLTERQPEFRRLALEHLDLERSLAELMASPHPDSEQLTAISEAKRAKLRIKDAMQVWVDRHRGRWHAPEEA